MGKFKLMGLLGVTLTIVMGIALIGCDQPGGSMPEATDTMLVAETAAVSTVSAQSVRANRQLTREEFQARLESRRLGAEERRQLAPDGLSERRGRARAAFDSENPGAGLPGEGRQRRTNLTREEWLQRRESRGSRNAP